MTTTCPNIWKEDLKKRYLTNRKQLVHKKCEKQKATEEATKEDPGPL